MVTLCNTTLKRLPIPAPCYDRTGPDGPGIGIVHFGVGGFHRAHQAVYIDNLLQRGIAQRWGICGVGVTPPDARMRDVLRAQDGLYTLVVEHPDGHRDARVIGSILGYRYAPDDPAAVVDLLAAPATRIISMTITEGGYRAVDGNPASVFPLIAAGLARRHHLGIPAPTIVSCDNIERNGDAARRATLDAAARVSRRQPGLPRWVEEQVRFPNSMVDRITPATTADVIAALQHDFRVEDRWPVTTEPFTSWVLEDDFSDGRPPLENAGVLLVDDVTPYEAMKLRLLNAGHQCLCYVAYLCGYRHVADAAADRLLVEFLRAYWASEAIPTLRPVPGVDLTDYTRTLIDRFANPGARDTVARLCAYSSDRIPTWLLPVVRDNLANGGPVRLAAATVAAWARYTEGVDEQGNPIEIVDRLAASLTSIARSQRAHPTAFIENTDVFGDLARAQRFVDAYRWALDSLHDRGVRATLRELLHAPGGPG